MSLSFSFSSLSNCISNEKKNHSRNNKIKILLKIWVRWKKEFPLHHVRKSLFARIAFEASPRVRCLREIFLLRKTEKCANKWGMWRLERKFLGEENSRVREKLCWYLIYEPYLSLIYSCFVVFFLVKLGRHRKNFYRW